MALATQAFVALVPMLIVLAGSAPAATREALGRWLAENILAPDTQAAVRPLTRSSPEPSSLAVGIAVLIVSVVGFTRTLQRTYHAAWDLPPPGWRGFGAGLAGAGGLVAGAGLLLTTAPLLRGLGQTVLPTTVIRALVAALLWWGVLWLLLGGRVSWRALLPGAALTGTGQALVMLVSGLVVPTLVERQSARYGLIGVAFVLVSWLVVLGVLVVVAAALSAEVGRHPRRDRPP